MWSDVVVKYIQCESSIKNIYNRIYTMNMLLYARLSEGDVYSHFSWLLWDDSDDGGSECIQCRLGSVWDGHAGRFF